MSPPAESSPSWRLFSRAISHHFSGSNPALPVMESADWDAMYELCHRHGLFPLVNRALQPLPPELFPDPYRERFRNAAAAVTLRSLQLQQEMQRLISLLTGAGIAVIPFKGPVLAEQAYGDVGLRDFVDLDLLVSKAQVADAVLLLGDHGYLPSTEISGCDWPKLLKRTNEVDLRHATKPWVVEVHWDFAKPWFGLTFPLDKLWEGADPGSSQNRLDDIDTVLQLCIHGTNHYWDKLKWLVDVDRFVRSVADLDWDELLLRSERAGCRRALLLGLSLADSCLGLPLPVTAKRQISACKSLQWLSNFARNGWLLSGESKRLLAGRVIYLLLCRETLQDRFLAIVHGVKSRRL